MKCSKKPGNQCVRVPVDNDIFKDMTFCFLLPGWYLFRWIINIDEAFNNASDELREERSGYQMESEENWSEFVKGMCLILFCEVRCVQFSFNDTQVW